MRIELGKRLIDNWIKTLESYETQQIVNLYSNKGILLGTLAEEPLVGKKQIKTYFDKFVTLYPEGTVTWWYNQRLSFNKVAIDGNYTFMLDDKKARKEVEARFTFVFKRNWWKFGTWEIITHHSSERPKNPTRI